MASLPHRLSFLTLLLCLSILGIVPAWGGPDPSLPEPLWPLDLPTRYLTSNFMEYRGGRFHAGIDLKTNAETGYPVRAVEDGYISRVRTTPFAYGRVVYQRGFSGKTYVYAHLMRFNDLLRPRVRAAQLKAGSYRTGLSFQAGEIPVKRGQVLGLSGQSGTSGPHLHFEVRDQNQRPVNPMDHGFAVQDTFPPVILSIRAWPATPDALADGSHLEQVLTVGSGNRLQGRLPELTFRGPVAFSARIQDFSDIRGHLLEPRVIEVRLDGDLVYRASNEVYSFEQNSLQRLEWAEHVDWEQHRVKEHWLHRRGANSLTGRQGDLWYLGPEGEGLSLENHLLTLTALDHDGGRVTVEIPLVPHRPGSEPSQAWTESPLGINDFSGQRLTPFFTVGNFSEHGGDLASIRQETGAPVLENLDLLIKPWPEELFLGLGEQGLDPAGPAALFMAVDWPIDSSLSVEFPDDSFLPDGPDPADPRTGVYRRDKNGVWELVGPVLSRADSDGRIGFLLGEPGLHAVARDTLPPELDQRARVPVAPFQGPGVPQVTMPFWELVPIFLADGGSGLAPESILASLDGRPLLVEPDLPRDRLLVELPDDLEPGSHLFFFEAADKAGNAASTHLEILCQGSNSEPSSDRSDDLMD